MDDYQRYLLDQQEARRAFEARFDSQRLAIEQQQYWIWFYKQCDRDDERLRAGREGSDYVSNQSEDVTYDLSTEPLPPGDTTDAYLSLIGEHPSVDSVLDLINAILSTNDRESDERRRLCVELVRCWELEFAPTSDDVAAARDRIAEAIAQPTMDPEQIRDSFGCEFENALRDQGLTADFAVNRFFEERFGQEHSVQAETTPWWAWFRERCEDVERSAALLRDVMRDSQRQPCLYDELFRSDASENRFAEIMTVVLNSQDLDRVEREKIARELYLWWKWFYGQCDKDLEHFMERARDADRFQAPDEPYSKGYLNRVFMTEALEEITKVGEDHPLYKLIDPATGRWVSRTADTDKVTVQAGHLVSRHSKVKEQFALEDSSLNAGTNESGEGDGFIFVKQAVLIGGVPVELRTARMWENTDILPKGTVAGATRHYGWSRAKGAGR